jgi:uncharacterized membrane protein
MISLIPHGLKNIANMKLKINKDKKVLNVWMTQVFIIWLLYVNYAVFIFPNYLFPFSTVSLLKIFISALISLLIVATAFCPSILIRKGKAETFLQYKKKIKYNNRIIIIALYMYKFIYWLIAIIKDLDLKDTKEQILSCVLLVLCTFIGALPDVTIVWLSKKIAFTLWENGNEKNDCELKTEDYCDEKE